jgi:hypothetical protein
MKKLRFFFTVLFLLTSLAVILLIAIFENTLLFRAAEVVKDHIWPAGITALLFLVLLFSGIVSTLSEAGKSLFRNGYFQLAVLELFLCSAALVYYRYHVKQPGQIILRLQPNPGSEIINLELKSLKSETTDTVQAPGQLSNIPAGRYSIETLDHHILPFRTGFTLEPAEIETLSIPLKYNTRSLFIQTEPEGAVILINGIQTSQTPDTLHILSGDTVNLELQMDGYQTYLDTISLDQDMTLGTISLLKLYTVWISARYTDIGYLIYDQNKRMVFSSRGSKKLQLAEGKYRIAYEIGEGEYDSKTFQLRSNRTLSIP